MNIAYARVSKLEQNLDRQLDDLNNYGVDKIFSEKMTGVISERPELDRLLENIREGDVVIVESLSRLGRSSKDLLQLLEQFEDVGVKFISLKENIDTSTPTGKLVITVLAAIAQFERDIIVARTREGLAAARARGRVGGRPRLDSRKVDSAVRLYQGQQHSMREIQDLTGVSPSTLYRHLRNMKSVEELNV